MSSPTLEITLLHTNDMHGHLEAMSRLSSFARQLRAQLESEGRRVFFVDAGDAADRRLRFCGVTKGAAFPPILQAMSYDLQTLGNALSITYGPQAAAQMAAAAGKLPILAANLFDAQSPSTAVFRPTLEFPLSADVRLAIVGLTVHSPDLYRLFGLEVPDFRQSAQRWLDELRQNGRGPCIAVTHLGLRQDHQLAEACPEFDVIIGGHSHDLLPDGEWHGNVLIAQAGNYAGWLGRVDLSIDPQSGAVLARSACVLPIPADAPLDPAVEAAIQIAEQLAAQAMAQPVAELQQALGLDYFAECGIADLAADALRQRMQAEAALLTSGLFTAGLPAGTVTLGDLDAASFSTANPQLSLVRGEQIVAALERGLEPERSQARLKIFRGAPTGIPVFSGMTVSYNPAAPAGQRVCQVQIGGQPLQNERLYRLAHTDAEVLENGAEFGYLILEEGQLLHTEVPTIVREFVADYLKEHSPVPPPSNGRWQIVQC